MRYKKWQKLEDHVADWTDGKLTRGSGRFDDKGDAENGIFLIECKSHQYYVKDGDTKLYTIIKEEWFEKLLDAAAKKDKIPMLAVEIGKAILYFIPQCFSDINVAASYKQNRRSLRVSVNEVNELYGKTVQFAHETWLVIDREDVKNIAKEE